MSETQFPLFIAMLGSIFTSIIGIYVTFYKDKQARITEARNRQWDIEDREYKARELENKVTATAEKIESKVIKSHEVIVEKLEENTKISENAFHEANSAKLVIADLTRIFADATHAGNKAQDKSDERIDKLEIPAQEIKVTASTSEILNRVDETTQTTLKEIQKKK
jgi:hypothetical protein